MTDRGHADRSADDVRLRALRWWDVERLMPIEQELFAAAAWTPEVFWAELAQSRTRWYRVAEDAAEQLIGYAGLMVSPGQADVQTVAVDPARQHRGLGTLLVRALIEEAVRRDAGCVLLEVRADNAGAVRLYRRHGFEQISLRRRYYQPGDVDALIMRLSTRPDAGPDAGPGA